MDLGKIMIGIALVILSIGLLVSPSGATGFDHSCTVGCGNAFSPADTMVTPYSPLGREYPADTMDKSSGIPTMGAHHDTPCPCHRRLL